MRKLVYAFAILAAAASTVAVAGEIKQDQKSATPTVSATQMSDTEMDKVTAGSAADVENQFPFIGVWVNAPKNNLSGHPGQGYPSPGDKPLGLSAVCFNRTFNGTGC
jgi:hypothetical protein